MSKKLEKSEDNLGNVVLLWPTRFYPALGGIETVTFDLARELRNKGFQIKVWTHRHEVNLPKFDTHNGIEVCRFLLPLPSRNIKNIARFLILGVFDVYRMIPMIKLNKPMLIHLHGLSANGLYALILSRIFSIPLFLTLHGETFADPNRIFQNSIFMRFIFKRVTARATKISAPSLYTLQNSLLEQKHLKKSLVIPNPITASRIGFLKTIDFPYILFAGRLEMNKGVDLLLEIFADLHNIAPQHRLYFVGEGPSKETLQFRSEQLGIRSLVSFIDTVSREELHTIIRGAEMTCLLSERESFGIVAIESFFLGTPVIGTTEGGLIEYLGGKPGCFLIGPKNADEILNTMILIIRESAKIRQQMNLFLDTLGEQSEFRIENVAQRYLKWYQFD